MAEHPEAMSSLALHIAAALDAADLAAFSDLLDPEVHWGPPDAASPTCQTRDQVLSWYRRGREAGTRARVSETTVLGDRILVGLRVTGLQAAGTRTPADRGGEAQRWQVLTVRDGRVIDIVGFDTRREAMARAGVPDAR